MLVQSDQLAEHARGERRREDRRGRPVAGEGAGGHECTRRALGLDLLCGLAERERLGLREEVRQEQAVNVAAVVLQRVGGVRERDEISRDEAGALVDELVERVLTVGSRFAPEHLAGVGGDGRAVPAHRFAVGFHRELLQIGGEAAELLGVGEHGVRLGAEEVDVPDVQEPHEHRHVLGERRRADVLVDGVESREQLAEDLGSELDHERQADGRVDRVAAADPVPEPEGVVGVDAEVGDLGQGGRDGDEVVGDRVGLRRIRPVDGSGCFEPRPQPVPREAGVGEGLERGEGLRGDDEERRLGVEPLGLLGHVGRVDVRHEPSLDAGIGIWLQRGRDHDRAEVRAADADVDDVGDLLAGHALPFPAAHPVGEGRHAREHLLHVVIDVLSVDDERGLGAGRTPQGGVQHRAVLGRVDVFAGAHRGVALGDTGLFGQLHQRGEDLVGDEVLRQVDMQVGEREAELSDTVIVGGEPAAQIGVERSAVGVELSPRGGAGRIDGSSHAPTVARRLGRGRPNVTGSQLLKNRAGSATAAPHGASAAHS